MLRHSADRRTIAFVLGHIFLFVIAWTAWSSLPTVAKVFFVVLLCVSSFLQAVITHNVMHTPVWRNRTLNRLTQLTLSLTYGFPVSEYVPGHNLSHHRYTQSERDVMRTTKVRFRINLVNILLFFFRVAPSVTMANAAHSRVMRTRQPRWFHQLLAEIFVAWGSKLILLAASPSKMLVLVMIPGLYALWGITTVNYLQHDGCDEDHPYNHSRNFVNETFNWFTFNNGFHGMHHMKPGLHWSLLAEAHRTELAPHMDSRLDEPSLVRYLLRAFVSPGRRLRYDGKPVVLPPDDTDLTDSQGGFEGRQSVV